ncbi:MAG: MBL fold metallo-hydrolase [Clostridia bacterium]|nr:MBL fold metallo-hydrolase [Clostridia bacterium]
MAKKQKKSKVLSVIFVAFAAIIGFVAGLIIPLYAMEKTFTQNIPTDNLMTHTETFYTKDAHTSEVAHGDINLEETELSVHFIELGNKYTGDCTLIKVGKTTEVLIDCGSRTDSIGAVSSYINQFCTDGILEYVIVTHAHQDHYAGFATPKNVDSIFDLYNIETIITFAKTNQKETSTMYKNFCNELDDVQKREWQKDEETKKAQVFTALECYNETKTGAKRTYDLSDDTKLEILYQQYYEEKAGTENDYSVCCMITSGTHNFLFTGDLESGGESSLVDKYREDKGMNETDYISVDLYKAGHHGSKTSSSQALLELFKPQIVCVCCCAGSPEYTTKNENQFPTQKFIDNIAKYAGITENTGTDQVFVTTLCIDYKNDEFTSFNGNIIVALKKDEFIVDDVAVVVSCSNNNTILKETDWFKQNRNCPDAWAT